ncbi:hypothetical protein Hypma_000393 [Hypsizygus marmoreus]|uniref:DUF7330 domain-containing protein n=1 Tax=Hypsizygus marmoreus TaxID=39966 RepID=A0A369J8Q1_HYPMA|nr:hypothetical protein Hypma_000393 [Hypsizygus marmoreus]
MAPEPPPGYSSQRSGPSPPQSFDTRSEDLVSAQSHPRVESIEELENTATARHSDVHFTSDVPRRRRYSSLPYDSSSAVSFPVHLQYNQPSSHVNEEPNTIIPAVSPSHNPIPISASLACSPSSSQRPNLNPNPSPNPTNYISLSRKSTPYKRLPSLSLFRSHASIKGKYTVNPYLHIPAALLSPSSSRRKNLRFEVENGGIDVDIFLVGEPKQGDSDTAVRTTLDLKIREGDSDDVSHLEMRKKRNTFPLIAKIHTPSPTRPPFHLVVAGLDGYHALHLPASFHGLVTIDVGVGDLGRHVELSKGFRGMYISPLILLPPPPFPLFSPLPHSALFFPPPFSTHFSPTPTTSRFNATNRNTHIPVLLRRPARRVGEG